VSETASANGFLDFLKAWMPVAVVVAGGLWAVFTFVDSQADQARERELNAAKEARAALVQARRPFLERKMALFFEASKLAGTLSRTPVGTKDWQAAEARFWTLYWGEMSIVEEGAVEDRMKKFGDALNAHKELRDADTAKDLQLASYRLAHALRDELAADWGDATAAGP
jgi:hypothetical protein